MCSSKNTHMPRLFFFFNSILQNGLGETITKPSNTKIQLYTNLIPVQSNGYGMGMEFPVQSMGSSHTTMKDGDTETLKFTEIQSHAVYD